MVNKNQRLLSLEQAIPETEENQNVTPQNGESSSQAMGNTTSKQQFSNRRLVRRL